MTPEQNMKVEEFVNTNIHEFHMAKLRRIQDLRLFDLIKKNPYLFRAKAIYKAQDLIENLLDAFLSSSEEELFGKFLENLAVFVSQITLNGQKSSAEGIDLEFTKDNIRYVAAIKSGTNWGNSQQQTTLEENFKTIVRRVLANDRITIIQPVLGICYGKTKRSMVRGYLKLVGQEFWTLISDDPNLYMDIIEPVGFRAREHNDNFKRQKENTINILAKQFMLEYCDDNGAINWRKLVFFVSSNLPKDKLPYGYKYTYTGIMIIDSEAEIISLIFKLRKSTDNERTLSYKAIADLLNQRGFFNKSGNKWNASNVSKIYKSEVMYKGGIVNETEKLPVILK